MIPRHLSARLIADARDFPVITLTGPRQSGKTTLARATFPDYAYVSLEDPEEREYALADPKGFLARFDTRVILDEVQRAPELFSYLQGIVDEVDFSGQFILTGSQNFLLMERLTQTLAGRTAIHHLLPLSLGEQLGRGLAPIEDLSANRGFEAPGRDLFEVLLQGGYPRIHQKAIAPTRWLRGYYQSYLERDVRQLLHVGDLDAFRRFVGLCAGRVGQLLNLSSLANDCGITHTTARRWLSVLEASFVVVLLRPYHRNFGKRLVKAPKLYFVDSGLLCYLLRVRDPESLRTHASRGAIFESWVLSELTKRALNAGMEPDLWFWRDARGHEIDLVVDAGKRPLLLEVKSGQTLSTDYFRNIDYVRQKADPDRLDAMVVYGGDRNEKRRGGHVRAWWNL